jgi:hypothetical protein
MQIQQMWQAYQQWAWTGLRLKSLKMPLENGSIGMRGKSNRWHIAFRHGVLIRAEATGNNLTRTMNIVGTRPLMAAIAA